MSSLDIEYFDAKYYEAEYNDAEYFEAYYDAEYFEAEDHEAEYFDAESSSDAEYFDAEYSFDAELDTVRISLEDILLATKNFAEENMLKVGGKADVYKGILLLQSKARIDVVIWKFGNLSMYSNGTFDIYEEIKRLSTLKHRNIVSLVGFCDEQGEKMIVMEFVIHGSLHRYLSDPTLTWYQRLHICFGATLALKFWHNINKKKCFNKMKGGFKILLDKDWEAKVLFCIESDTENSEVLYCLGMILLEMLYGRKVTIRDVNLYRYEEVDNMIAPNLRAQMHPHSLSIFSETAYNCLKEQLDQPRKSVFDNTMKRLKEAFQIQWKHENVLRVQKFAYMEIPLSRIKLATDDFSYTYLIESYKYDRLYKAELDHFGEQSKNHVIIQRFDYKTMPKDFFAEIEMLSSCNHPNLLSLLGFCDEESEMILVFECDFKETLNDYLRSNSNRTNLTWEQQVRISLEIAHGLKYLHNMECESSMIHHEILSVDVFLDDKWTAKIAGFRLSEFSSYLTSLGQLGKRLVVDDIYFLGVILFEILTGNPVNYDAPYMEGDVNKFASMVRRHFTKKMSDPRIVLETYSDRKGPNQDSFSTFSKIAYQCLVETPSERPPLEVVIKSLEKAFHLQVQENLRIPLEVIRLATKNFDETYRIGLGVYGAMYKGELKRKRNIQFNIDRHKKVVVKRFSPDRYLNNILFSWEFGFLKEFEVLLKYKQENIIGLVGYCKEMEEKIIVYEHTKGSLNRYLKDPRVSWPKRLKICIDIANALKFLHGGDVGQDVVIHRDIKSSNILLTKDWKAKICGFEHALTYPLNKKIEYVINDVEGSPGYCDPLYWETHVITKESDIYSFGVILFEILCGRLACPKDFKDRSQFLNVLVKHHFQVARLDEIVFEGIKEQIAQQSLATFGRIAFQCLHDDREQRPTIGDVVVELQKALEFQEALHVNYKEILQVPERLKIPLEIIRMATNNFDEKYHLGSGGYGAVYKAELSYLNIRSSLAKKMMNKDALAKPPYTLAIKRIFSRDDNQEKEGFFTELDVLSRCEHPNIVSLLGCCVEGGEMLLAYEYVSNGSLADYLESKDKMFNLTWAQRLKMCIDIAQGLNYLHTNMEDKRTIVHRDIKSANILLGKKWEAKIADFGLSKFFPVNHQASTINTNIIAGTHMYLDPEYDRTGSLKRASDIYSFGVVLFEIFSGKLAYDPIYVKRKKRGLAPIAKRHFEMGTLNEVMLDPKTMDDEAYELGLNLKVRPDHDSLDTFSKIACQCLAKTQAERPTIEVVVKELNKALCFQEKRLITLRISLEDVKMGVENFSDDKCIMKGEYGRLYKGKVPYNNSHKEVVVKRFNPFDQEDGFLKEFEVLFQHRQENVVGLLGYCKEMDEKIIVYECASIGSLDRYLNNTSFSWTKRLKACIDIANGLKFLHEGDVGLDVVIHRDIKSSNILLTKDWKAKICGFELSLTYPSNQDMKSATSDIVGSPGYCDPLYWETHILTKESDIYSFGVILFEMLCGRLACPEDFIDSSQFLGDLAKHYSQVAQLDEIVFEGIKDQIIQKSFATFQKLALQCLHEERKKRPTAGEAVVQLQRSLEFQEAYEIRKGKLHRTYKDILNQFSLSHEIYSTMRKKDIYNILSKGILLEDDKPITHISEQTIWDLEQSDEDYYSQPDHEDYYLQPDDEDHYLQPDGEDC